MVPLLPSLAVRSACHSRSSWSHFHGALAPAHKAAFLCSSTNCVQSSRKRLSHCWAGGAGTWGDGARKGLVTRQRAGGSEPCARASSSAGHFLLRSKRWWGSCSGSKRQAPWMVTVTSVCHPAMETQRVRGAPLILRSRHEGAQDH